VRLTEKLYCAASIPRLPGQLVAFTSPPHTFNIHSYIKPFQRLLSARPRARHGGLRDFRHTTHIQGARAGRGVHNRQTYHDSRCVVLTHLCS
jgi:hypothetical protein